MGGWVGAGAETVNRSTVWSAELGGGVMTSQVRGEFGACKDLSWLEIQL